MGSLTKSKDSRFWRAQFYVGVGTGRKKVFRSTGTVDKREARRIMEVWEDAAGGRVNGEQARRVLADLLGEGERRIPVREFAEQWLAQRKLEVEGGTVKFYAFAVAAWVEGLGPVADLPLDTLTESQVVAWRERQARLCSSTTVNHYMKCVRMILHRAVEGGWLRKNPAAGLRPLKKTLAEKSAAERRPFTPEELERVLAVCSPEWRGMVLLGLYTGQRLGDLACCEVGHLREGAVFFAKTQKTGAAVWVPLPKRCLRALADCQQPGARWVFPQLWESMQKNGVMKTNELSRQFADILAAAGLREKEVRATRQQLAERRAAEVLEKGAVDRRRGKNELVFHSLRHNTRTALEESGAPVAVIDALMGQDARTGRGYTHIGKDALRRAAEGIHGEG